jgi:hypothetical protein
MNDHLSKPLLLLKPFSAEDVGSDFLCDLFIPVTSISWLDVVMGRKWDEYSLVAAPSYHE